MARGRWDRGDLVALPALSVRPCELLFLLCGVLTREATRLDDAAAAPACLEEDSISSEDRGEQGG